ncbi:MAG: CBS domain-containing protein [Nitrospirae bacterium]|nr:CBS domain-containing protein [Nitrospirota bacterium]
MIKNNITRLPVVDKAGKIIGMLYERNIFAAITKTMLDKGQGDKK